MDSTSVDAGDGGSSDGIARSDSQTGDTGSSESGSADSSGGDSAVADATADTSTVDAGSDASDASCGPCMPTFICCNGACINPNNDILNCGFCGRPCGGPHPYCDNGTCGTAPCMGAVCGGSSFCCSTQCCTTGQLCCAVPGPVGTVVQCSPPVNGTCPVGCTGCVCASPDTPIATPLGDRPIADLAAGDLVYSVDHDAIVAVPLLRVHRTPVHDHQVMRVVLASGAVLEVSAPHPTADGRTFGDLRAGDVLDRNTIVSAELVPYAHPYTYDILPASETRTYFAGGALIGSTLGGQ